MIKHKEKTAELQECYDRGYNAGYFGANTQNCHFSIFSTPERTGAWKRGNDDGSYKREQVIAQAKTKKKKAI